MKSPVKSRKITRGGDFLNTYLNYMQARDAAWQMLIDCHVTELPVKVETICQHYEWTLATYTEARQALEALDLMRLAASTDGFCLHLSGRYYIFFDDHTPRGRQRFTIAHEIGHIMLGHVGAGECTIINRDPKPTDAPEEVQANQFATRILAPAWVLHSIGATTPVQIAKVCDISNAAARFRAKRMEELEKRNRYLSHTLEQQIAQQFESYVARFRGGLD